MKILAIISIVYMIIGFILSVAFLISIAQKEDFSDELIIESFLASMLIIGLSFLLWPFFLYRYLKEFVNE